MAEKDIDSKLDAIAAHLDSLHKRMDSDAEERKADKARMDAACARMDSAEEERKADKAKKDAEEMAADKARKDAAEKEEEEKAEKVKADAAKKDADEKEKKAKADAARADANPELRAQIADLQARISRMPADVTDEDRAHFVAAQSQAERVAQAFGDSAGAPRWLNGETVPQYRRRLLSKYKAHSADWKDADLSKIADDSALTVIEKRIYADAMQAALHPTDLGAGQLREIKRVDAAGRTISNFVGSETAAWAPFANPHRRGKVVRPPQH